MKQDVLMFGKNCKAKREDDYILKPTCKDAAVYGVIESNKLLIIETEKPMVALFSNPFLDLCE